MLSRLVLLVLAAPSAHATDPTTTTTNTDPPNFVLAKYQPKNTPCPPPCDTKLNNKERTDACADYGKPSGAQEGEYREIDDPAECIIAAYSYYSGKAKCTACHPLDLGQCKLPSLPGNVINGERTPSTRDQPWEKIINVMDSTTDYGGCAYVTDTELVEINSMNMYGCSLSLNTNGNPHPCCPNNPPAHPWRPTPDQLLMSAKKKAVRFCKHKDFKIPKSILGVENTMEKMQHELTAIHKLLDEVEHQKSVNGSFQEGSFQRLEKAVEAAQSSLGEVATLNKERHGSLAPGAAVMV